MGSIYQATGSIYQARARLQFEYSTLLHTMIINTTSRNLEAKKKRAAAITVALVAASLAQHFAARYHNKTPKNTSKLTGQQWLNELLTGHHQRFMMEWE